MNVDISKIPYFLAAAEHLNFTEAANECYVTQSALSKSIAVLEESIGFPLFVRGNRKISLTAEGAYLYQEFSKYSASIDEAIEKAINIRAGVSGGFTMYSCGYLPENRRFKDITSRFFFDNPMFRMEIIETSYPKLRTFLLDDKADAILTGSQNLSLIKNIEFLTVAKGHPVLLCNPVFYERYEGALGLEAFQDAEFVTTRNSPDYLHYLSSCCESYGFRPKITYVYSLREAVFYVSNMNYVTVLDTVQYPVEQTDLKVVDIPVRPGMDELNLLLAWKKNNQNPALQYYVEHVKAELSDQQLTSASSQP